MLLSLITFCLTAAGVYTYHSIFSNVETMLGQKLDHIARTAVLLIDPADHQKIEDALMAQEENVTEKVYFKRIQKTLQNIKNSNELSEDIYTVIAPDWADGTMIFMSMSNEKTYVGNSIKLQAGVSKALATGKPTYSKIYSDAEGVWVSAFAPILNSEGKAIAAIEVDYHAEREIAAARKQLLQSIGVPAVVAIFLSLIFGNIIGKILSRPIQKLNQAATQVSAGNLDVLVENKSEDEIGVLSRVFNLMVEDLKSSKIKLEDYARNLELKVEERTQKLAVAVKANTTLLNNLGQGFMIIQKNGSIAPGSTKAASAFFGTEPSGKELSALLQLNTEETESLKDWLELCFAEVVAFDSLKELGPSAFEKIDGRYVEISYRPIYSDDEKIVEIICIAEDKTKERNLERIAFEEKEYSLFILNLIKDRAQFHDFVANTFDGLEKLRKDITAYATTKSVDVDDLFRFFHTVKGEAACFHVLGLKENAHVAEDILAQLNADSMPIEDFKLELDKACLAMQTSLKQFVTENAEVIGSAVEDGFQLKTINSESLQKLDQKLKATLGKNSYEYRFFVETLLLEDIANSFEKYKKVALDLALQQNKNIQFHIEKNKVHLAIDVLKPLISSCVHLFRNVVDHGIETVDQRFEANKPETAQVLLKFDDINEGQSKKLRICLEDDGRGVNPEVIRSKLILKGLKNETELNGLSDHDVIQMIFLPQFSSLDSVNSISGRGVGLDAISTEVTKLCGQVWVESEVGKGSRFIIEIPLSNQTLSIAS